MGLYPLETQWRYGLNQPVRNPDDVARTLRDIGGYLSVGIRRSGGGMAHEHARIAWLEGVGQYSWRLSLPVGWGERLAGTHRDEWQQVEDFRTLREALAAARRYCRKPAFAVLIDGRWVPYRGKTVRYG